jgi:hypothetical protein
MGADKVVGVLNAAGTTLHVLQFAELEFKQQGADLFGRNFCVNRHESENVGTMHGRIVEPHGLA